ncbi:unnamed protein product [Phytophthora fragariaefolia]|uniref:Unnamed protein product n=1 Tax=Phytophthora fragariaefolia TaxID=1490495 RepID=A0A9W7DA11_9STRA|nr:unnamed protein product [Phytophthora fragariaefolia]
MTSVSNRDLCRFFYVEASDHYFACNYCGTRRKQLPSSGYANLINHLKDKHPNYVDAYNAHQRRQAGSLTAHGFVNPTASNMYQWMEWVVDRNISLSEVDDPLTRNMSKQKQICSKTLKVFMGKVVAAVEAKISSEMTSFFGIMFDR